MEIGPTPCHSCCVAGQIIGRDAELAAAASFLDAIPSGLAALGLEGEPGIGKTTVWRAAADRGRERRYRVLACRPAEAEATLSFAGLTDLLANVK